MPLDNDDIKQLIAILQKGLTLENSEHAVEKKTKPTSENKFDAMLEKNLHRDDIEFDKKVAIIPPVLRSREFKLITVKCRSCGKEDRVNSNAVDSIDRYKCNRCCTNPG